MAVNIWMEAEKKLGEWLRKERELREELQKLYDEGLVKKYSNDLFLEATVEDERIVLWFFLKLPNLLNNKNVVKKAIYNSVKEYKKQAEQENTKIEIIENESPYYPYYISVGALKGKYFYPLLYIEMREKGLTGRCYKYENLLGADILDIIVNSVKKKLETLSEDEY